MPHSPAQVVGCAACEEGLAPGAGRKGEPGAKLCAGGGGPPPTQRHMGACVHAMDEAGGGARALEGDSQGIVNRRLMVGFPGSLIILNLRLILGWGCPLRRLMSRGSQNVSQRLNYYPTHLYSSIAIWPDHSPLFWNCPSARATGFSSFPSRFPAALVPRCILPLNVGPVFLLLP